MSFWAVFCINIQRTKDVSRVFTSSQRPWVNISKTSLLILLLIVEFGIPFEKRGLGDFKIVLQIYNWNFIFSIIGSQVW